MEIVDPADLSVVAGLGLDSYGGRLACLDAERVVLTAYDAVPGAIVAGSERTVIVEQDGITELAVDPDLWVVGRNASD